VQTAEKIWAAHRFTGRIFGTIYEKCPKNGVNFGGRLPRPRPKYGNLNPRIGYAGLLPMIRGTNGTNTTYRFREPLPRIFPPQVWGKFIRPSAPRPQITLGGWNFASARPPPRPLKKKISSAPAPFMGEIWGVKGKFSPHAPSKSFRCIGPKFGTGPALDAAYEQPKFGEPSVNRFGARAKSAVFRRPRSTTCTKTLERSQMILLHITKWLCEVTWSYFCRQQT